MFIHQIGLVKKPFSHKGWSAELTGDAENSGGFYLILTSGKQELLFWDTTEALVLAQAETDCFAIEWATP